MPTLTALITGLVQGDGIDITVNISKTIGDFKSDPITKAWFTVKNKVADADTAAIFQKVITTSNTPGVGEIVDDGDVSGTPQVRIELVNADTVKLSGAKSYLFDLQVITVSGGADKPYTPWKGTIKMAEEITKATS